MSRQLQALTILAAATMVLAAGGLAPALRAADTKTDAAPATANAVAPATNSVATKAPAPAPAKTAVKKQLTGAELYSMHCNRCHPERYPTERTAAQWKTIMLHMQVRASLPADQAKLILEYLQQNSGR